MGESKPLIRPNFNKSLQIEGRPEKLSSDSGALILREIDDRLGLTRMLTNKLVDRRSGAVVHSMPELLRTAVMLPALGWSDQDDADFLRHDPALRLAVSDHKGITPLSDDGPSGLPSQPTLSRLHEALSGEENREILGDHLMEMAARRVRASNGGHRQRYVTIDIDSFPVGVDGKQPGAEYNGYYGEKIFHPIIAASAELGDILAIKLRSGNVHTAEGGLDFILDVVDAANQKLCQVAAVRMDAGYPDEDTLKGLEDRRIPYVSRVKNNAKLNEIAAPYLKRERGRPPKSGQEWTVEMEYQAASWSKSRRMVLVIVEEPGQLFLRHFWLVTNWSAEQKSGDDLLAEYRQRGTAEGIFGELMTTISPALSSNARRKSHYRGRLLPGSEQRNQSFWINQTRLVLAAMTYNLLHAARTLTGDVIKKGISLQRVREQFLKVAGRITTHARRITVTIVDGMGILWHKIWNKISQLKLE